MATRMAKAIIRDTVRANTWHWIFQYRIREVLSPGGACIGRLGNQDHDQSAFCAAAGMADDLGVRCGDRVQELVFKAG